jgi:ATP-dependent Clp protease ATP-binding subunit ClpC
LIGSPPGYVGYEEGGQLTEKIRRKPYSVVLFDEIEKAHPDVFNMLLQILEDGRLTDSQGRTVDFKNTIVVMTSNLGARQIMEPKKLGFSIASDQEGANYGDMKGRVMEEVKKLFRPEFLNRVDDIIVFHPLGKDDVRKIAELLTKGVVSRMMENGITVEFSTQVYDLIATKGYDQMFGARPLRRAIQSIIEDKFAEEILLGNLKPGDSISLDVENGEIKIVKK